MGPKRETLRPKFRYFSVDNPTGFFYTVTNPFFKERFQMQNLSSCAAYYFYFDFAFYFSKVRSVLHKIGLSIR